MARATQEQPGSNPGATREPDLQISKQQLFFLSQGFGPSNPGATREQPGSNPGAGSEPGASFRDVFTLKKLHLIQTSCHDVWRRNLDNIQTQLLPRCNKTTEAQGHTSTSDANSFVFTRERAEIHSYISPHIPITRCVNKHLGKCLANGAG